MPAKQQEAKNPEQEQFRKQRLLAQKVASWRNHRYLIGIIGAMLGVYLLFSLPWAQWKVTSLLRHAAGFFRAGSGQVRQVYVPFRVAELNGDRAMEEVKALVAIGPRVAGTPGAQKAADYLAARLKELGISPIVDEFAN